jgi:(R,R)-butanediol dehydrogenase/meso-butanediol dehydrogenase/diacetyl reductase
MKAAVFDGPGRPLAIDDVADPVPGPGDLVLRVMACGICGSDLHLADVADAAAGVHGLPRGAVMGHEFSGEVVAAGSDARAAWEIGARATALPFTSCGACAACHSGAGGRCANGALLGLGALPGAYAEFVRVSAHESVRLPDNVGYGAGATVEPLSVGLHAVHAAGLQPGESVLVMGAGPIGLAVALWSRFFGARHVIVSDLVPARLERAAQLGATATIDASREDVVERIKSIAGERPEVVIECVGVRGTQQLAMDYAPVNGRIVVAGVCMEPDRILPVKAITKELQVHYVIGYRRRDFAFTVDMLAAGRIDSAPMISGAVGFDTFPATFEALKHSKTDCKVLLEPQR